MQRSTAVNVFLAFLLGGVFLYLAARNVAWTDLVAAFGRFDARWLLPAVLVSLAIMVLRAWRWQLELLPLERIPLARLWVVCAVAYTAINLLPARLGEVVRPWLLSRRSGIRFSSVVGNLIVEKTMDSIVIAFYVLLGLLVTENLPTWVRRGAVFPAVGAALLAAVTALLWWRGEPFVRRRVVGFLPERFGEGILRVTRSLLAGMSVLPDPKLLSGVAVISVVLWFLPILSSYIVILAFDFRVPFQAALLVFIFIGFGTALPQAPGMVGLYQYACVLALGLFGVPQADALAYGLVLNALQLFTIVAQGLVALPFAGVKLEDLLRRPAASPVGQDA
ncbi:MAG: membrane protein [Candidatus Binatia bacterium]|nr:MAG: membrane protein [Candidatus Binatia bacterium]